ncbi:6-phosphogluconolactonase [Variovorax sp. WDL1]|nr:6-phosphogluconolactonase [Variovorax sp. WDL1]
MFALDDATGALSPIQQVAVGGMLMPMALSPDRRRLYVARRSEPLAVAAFAIDPADGRLTALGEAALPHSMAYIATDRSGRNLLSASYGGHLIAVSPIGADGVPGPARQVLPTGPNAHCIQADPANRNVYATSLGGGVLVHWRFDPASGDLAEAEPNVLRLHAGSGPRHFVWDAQGRIMYLLGELDGSVSRLGVDPESGRASVLDTISALPPGFAGEAWAADLRLTPDGRFLYASERKSSTLALFHVDPASGKLTAAGHVRTESQPRGFAIDPSGRFLVAAGQASNRIAVYTIAADSGALAPCGATPVGQGPNWVEIVRLES